MIELSAPQRAAFVEEFKAKAEALRRLQEAFVIPDSSIGRTERVGLYDTTTIYPIAWRRPLQWRGRAEQECFVWMTDRRWFVVRWGSRFDYNCAEELVLKLSQHERVLLELNLQGQDEKIEEILSTPATARRGPPMGPGRR